jgi:uncharacterized repeat protein (TIGR01451 family)
MGRLGRARVALIVVGLVGNAGVGGAVDRGAELQRLLARLKQTASSQGSVSIIAKLRVQHVDALTAASARHQVAAPDETRWSATAADRALADAIAEATKDVTNRLSGTDYTINHIYRSIPFVALRVSADALDVLASLPQILDVEEDHPMQRIDPVPETGTTKQSASAKPPETASRRLDNTVELIGAPNAWAMGYTGSGWYVAILDDGIRRSHGFFAGKTIEEACFALGEDGSGPAGDCPNGQSTMTGVGSAVHHPSSYGKYGHGTHVTGIAAGNNGTLFGVAKDADIVAVQVYSRFSGTWCGGGNCVMSWNSDQIAGLDYVYSIRGSHSIAAVNFSLGGGKHASACDADARKASIDNLRAVGIATAAATGNEDYCGFVDSPACISTCVSVGASNDADQEYYSNNWHPTLQSLFAPGVTVYSSTDTSDTSYGSSSGTSMATPHVAGAWALLRQSAPSQTVGELLAALRATGVSVTSSCDSNLTRIPRIQVDRAIRFLHLIVLTKSGTLSNAVVGDPALTEPGDEISYTFEVRNTTTAAFSNILLTDPLTPSITCRTGNPIPSLAPGATETCSATHVVTQGNIDARQVVNTASATGLDAEGSPFSVTTSTTVRIPVDADLQLAKTVDPTASLPGQLVTYRLTVRNLGPYPALDTMVMDRIPDGLSWVSDTCGFGPPQGGERLWEVGGLARGASATCVVTARIDRDPPPTVLVNHGYATSSVTDPTPDDAHAKAELTVLAPRTRKHLLSGSSTGGSPRPPGPAPRLTYAAPALLASRYHVLPS